MTGFDAVNVQAVIPQQAVTVGLTDTVEGELFLFIDRVLIRNIADQRLTNQRHVTCRAVLTVCVQAVYGLEMAVFQTQRVHVAVHQAYEGILATGGEIGHRYAGIVTRLQVDTANQLGNRNLHTRLQEHQRGTLKDRVPGCPRIVTDGDQIRFFEFTCLHRLADNVAGHHFGQAGRVTAGIGILFCQHFARVVIDQDVGFRVDLRNARDHGLDIQVIGVSCRERSRAKGRGQRHALHKTSRKSGLHGQNYDIRDGIKKSALL